jgi:hypothetical protein
MDAQVAGGRVASFKAYTAWGPDGRGYSLTDPAVGLPIVQHAHDLGVTVFCAHKGLPLQRFDLTHNSPEDLVAVAAQYPDMQFVVFHSGFERAIHEGSYDAARHSTGTASLRTPTSTASSGPRGVRSSRRRTRPRTSSASC